MNPHTIPISVGVYVWKCCVGIIAPDNRRVDGSVSRRVQRDHFLIEGSDITSVCDASQTRLVQEVFVQYLGIKHSLVDSGVGHIHYKIGSRGEALRLKPGKVARS